MQALKYKVYDAGGNIPNHLTRFIIVEVGSDKPSLYCSNDGSRINWVNVKPSRSDGKIVPFEALPLALRIIINQEMVSYESE